MELFRSLINGRRRFIRREGAETATCALAEDIDRFLRSAGGLYSDSELFLQLNEEPAEDA